MKEEWRPVPGYEGLYDVSNHGRVVSHDRVVEYGPTRSARRRGRELRQAIVANGYLAVSLSKNRHKKMFRVHRLVAAAFIGPSDVDVLHADDDKLNNRLDNLRYGTDAENARDRVRNGRDHNYNKSRCVKGHEYTPANTYRAPATGHRSCKSCRAEVERKRKPRRVGNAA
jgi:hypothetical protein